MNIWYLYPLLVGVLIALAEFSSKLVAGYPENAETKSILANVFGAVCALAVVPFENIQYTFNALPLLVLLINGFIMASAYILFYKAYKNVDASIATLLTKSSILVFSIGGVFIFNERLSTIDIIGATLIVMSLLAISIKDVRAIKNFRFSKSIGTLLFVGIIFGVSTLQDNYLSNYFSPFLYLFILFSLTLVILSLYFFFIKKLTFSIRKPSILIASFVSISFSVAGQALMLTTYRLGGYVSISNLIALVRIPIVVLLGILILRERDQIPRKIVSMVILITGLILLKL